MKLTLAHFRLIRWLCLPAALFLCLTAATPVHAQGVVSGLVGYWPFDEVSGGLSPDRSGYDNKATLQSGAKLSTVVATTPFLNSASLASTPVTNSYATAAANVPIRGLVNFTIAFWVHLEPPKAGVFDLVTLNKAASVQFVNTGGLGLQFQVYADITRTVSTKLSVIHPWQHVAAVYDSNGLSLYVDGQLAGNTPRSTTLFAIPTGVTFSSPTTPFNGLLDDVRIYNRALSSAEIATLAYTCGNVTEMPGSECQALASLFYQANGIEWTNRTGWEQTNTPCSWFGVTCTNGHVTALNLVNNNVTGFLPQALGDLSELTSLQLNGNQLIGTIPATLGKLSKLGTLTLSENRLTGPIPAELGQLTQLQFLRLQNNNLFNDVPPALANLVNLQRLQIDYNMLTATDPAALAFLAAKSPNWGNTQTLPPTNLQVTRLSNTSVQLDWTPIAYTADGGYYEIWPIVWPSGSLLPIVRTSDKQRHNITIASLPADATVEFSMLTVTPAHGLQQNLLQSYFSNRVRINLNGNLSPVAVNDSYTGTRAGIRIDLVHGVLQNDYDPDNTSPHLRAIQVVTPTHGSLLLNADGSFVYQPAIGFVQGVDHFQYKANDGLNDSNTAVVTLTITLPNQAPIAVSDNYTTTQDTPLTVDAAHGLLANDHDPDGDPLTIGSISGVNPGSKFALNLDGSFTYTPAVGFVGTETFTYQASDGQTLSHLATVAFQVKPKPSPQSATITIALDVQPDSRTNFSFKGSLGAFLLDDLTPQDNDPYTNSKTFTVPAGVYTVTEALPTGYLDANISCNPPAGTIADLTKHQIVINAASGATITCTFVAQRAGMIIAGKYNDHNHNHQRNNQDEWLNNWQMQLHSPFTSLVATQATVGDGRTVFNNLFAGTYTVCEVPQTGWFAITPNVLNPTYQQPCYTVNVAAGQAVWTRFGNSNTPVIAAAEDAPFTDIVVCDLPATDDGGNELAAERDPWEEEEAAGSNSIFLPLVER
ncbi:MAG: Ig-like domain-containing protein [Caldilineaceae bacterium]